MREMQKYFEQDVPEFIKEVKREFEDYVDSDKSLRIMFGRDRFRDKFRRARRRVGKYCGRILPEKSKQATTHTSDPVAESTTPSPEPNAPDPQRQDEPGFFSHAFFAILLVSLLCQIPDSFQIVHDTMKLFGRRNRLSDKLARTSRQIGEVFEEWGNKSNDEKVQVEMLEMRTFFERDAPP
ncbi:hypothetical protein Poli38472_004654 [Pythium oligandrum]|uniref:Uncharacterized protein n=1 Tax=Pythium oligandrum TaxID=41045 RepID=A0A8K1CB59_PYTOL|nr:hypothetical protein Poli38472_004654 [Pythium oligandrum]|eukprot:TMW59585.1 hypothetical protein Poli38472_004654 [Pythium oligandrum]